MAQRQCHRAEPWLGQPSCSVWQAGRPLTLDVVRSHAENEALVEVHGAKSSSHEAHGSVVVLRDAAVRLAAYGHQDVAPAGGQRRRGPWVVQLSKQSATRTVAASTSGIGLLQSIDLAPSHSSNPERRPAAAAMLRYRALPLAALPDPVQPAAHLKMTPVPQQGQAPMPSLPCSMGP
jgi:hypothetical protein